jgi:hypothetical protein
MDTIATVKTRHFGTIPVRHRDCPLCGRNNDDVVPSGYSQEPWMIRECPSCDFVYIDSAPQYKMQFETMAWERTTKVEEVRRAEIRPISYRASKRTRFRMHILPKRTMLGFIAARIGGGMSSTSVVAAAKQYKAFHLPLRRLASKSLLRLHRLPIAPFVRAAVTQSMPLVLRG